VITYTLIFFTTTITIITKKRYLAAIKASYRLVKKKIWYFLGMIIIFETMISIVQLIIKNIFGILSKNPSPIIGFSQTLITQIAILPITIAIIIWYLSINKKTKNKRLKVKGK